MTEQIYLNGQYVAPEQAKISVLDRGFLFGDGVYEVIPAYHGRPFRLADHIDRLQHSLTGIRLELNYSVEDWWNIIQPMMNTEGDQSIYLQVTRGVADKRDHAFPAGICPTVLVMCHTLQPFAGKTNGVCAITTQDNRWHLCHLKTTALLGHVLARQVAVDQDCAEAILLRDGRAVEGAASNLFAVIDDVVITPPKSHDLLAGITRQVLLELAQTHNINWREADLTLADLGRASELWLTSSIREVVPVVRLDGNLVGNGTPGPKFKQMDALFQTYKRTPT